MNSIRRFDGLAAVYAAGRPAYAEAFLEDLYKKYGFSADSVIADVGSGTGKFAKQLIERGSFVYCVEPNADMRGQAERELAEYRNCKRVDGSDSDTRLQENTVDFVTAAQAFHWFDAELFRKECKRILRPEGKVFLVWNVRDADSPLVQKSGEIFRQYCPRFKGFTGGMRRDDPRIKRFFRDSYELLEYDYPLCYSREKFISRCLSSSYSLNRQDAGFADYAGSLKALFDEFSENGVILMPNKTVAYMGMVH